MTDTKHARTLAGLVAQYEITPVSVENAFMVAALRLPTGTPAAVDAMMMALLVESLLEDARRSRAAKRAAAAQREKLWTTGTQGSKTTKTGPNIPAEVWR